MDFWSTDLPAYLEKEMATPSSILVWRIPWTEEPGRLQSTGSQRVGHDWVTITLPCLLTWHPVSSRPHHPLPMPRFATDLAICTGIEPARPRAHGHPRGKAGLRPLYSPGYLPWSLQVSSVKGPWGVGLFRGRDPVMTGPLLWDFCWGSPPALPGEDTPCGGATEPLPMLTVASETMPAQSSLETCLEVQSQGAWEGQTTLPRQ